jgi:glycosyltransferase involved in cell wall biosynthesis
MLKQINSNSTETIWIDLTDLILHFRNWISTTGVQRVCLELYRRFSDLATYPGQIRFMALDANSARVIEIPRNQALAFLNSASRGIRPIELPSLAEPQSAEEVAAGPVPSPTSKQHPHSQLLVALKSRLLHLPKSAGRRLQSLDRKLCALGLALLQFLPPRMRLPVRTISLALREITAACAVILIETLRWPISTWQRVTKRVHESPAPEPPQLPSRSPTWLGPNNGDVILSFGASWATSNYWAHMRGLRETREVRIIALIYDVIPLVRPEWYPKAVRDSFREYLVGALTYCSALFVLSGHTERDLRRVAAAAGLALPPVATLAVGRDRYRQAAFRDEFALKGCGQSEFVLCVSTIDVRKNQRLLFDIWTELRRRLGHDRVPQLVLAGKLGHLRGDLCELLANSGDLSGKIVVLKDVDEDMLDLLYDKCLFTVFPSLYEGWGLPIGESVAYGKYCVAAKSGSITEVIGDAIDYFDPLNFADAYAALERPIVDRDYLARRAKELLGLQPFGWDLAATENWKALQTLFEEIAEVSVEPKSVVAGPQRRSRYS